MTEEQETPPTRMKFNVVDSGHVQDVPSSTSNNTKNSYQGRMSRASRSRSLGGWTPSRRFRTSIFKGRFCCCLSLQAGVCMYSSMGIVTMLSSIILNITGSIHELDRGYEWIEYSVLYIYLLSITSGFALTYFGAVKPSLKCLKIGNVIVLVFTAFWLIISALSFIDKPDIIHSICIDRRCPESHWLVKTAFRTYGDDCVEKEDPLLDDDYLFPDENGTKNAEKVSPRYKTNNKSIDIGDTGLITPSDDSESTKEPYYYDFDYVSKRPKLPAKKRNSSGEDYEDIGGQENINGTSFSGSNSSRPDNSEDIKVSKLDGRLGLEGMDLVLFESRITGCSSKPIFTMVLSILVLITWLAFMINGIVGAFLLVKDIKEMIETGELNRALHHVGFNQERQSRQSQMISVDQREELFVLTAIQSIYLKGRLTIEFVKMPVSKEKLKKQSSAAIKEATPAGGGYAGFFSLQAGTVLTSTNIFAVAFITFFYNLSAPNDSFITNEYITQYFVVYSYVSLAMIGTFLVSTFAFLKKSKWLLVGSIFVTCSSVYWFVMALLSFFPSLGLFKYLCIMDRCPPTHWLFEVPWRNVSFEENLRGENGSRFLPFPNAPGDSENSNDTNNDNSSMTSSTTNSAPDRTQPIDLNSRTAAFPSNATETLVGDCDHPPTISNAFLLKELHDLEDIETLKKKVPTDYNDDKDDEDTILDNNQYGHVDLENIDFGPTSHNSRIHDGKPQYTTPETSTSSEVSRSGNSTEDDKPNRMQTLEKNGNTSTYRTPNLTAVENTEESLTKEPRMRKLNEEPEKETTPEMKTSQKATESDNSTDTEKPAVGTTLGNISDTSRGEIHNVTSNTSEPTTETIAHWEMEDDNEDDYPEDALPGNESEMNWQVNLFMSSIQGAYNEDSYAGNIAMSVICFVVFTIFLVYGLVCMYYMHKQLKRRQREKDEEEEEHVPDEENIASRTSLHTHPSRKSQRSQ